jgi:hypothetical protein
MKRNDESSDAQVHRATRDVVIARRFRGPPDSANGGFACGVLACRAHGAMRVRLHEPPPLETPMSVVASDTDEIALLLDGRPIATARPSDRVLQLPVAVDYDRAVRASLDFAWYEGHPFASCFVCGPERAQDDGLRIFPGAASERGVVAAPWVPSASVCDASGAVQPEIVWAALDCPSWFGILAFEPGVGYALLGELDARIVERPHQGDRCVVLGWAGGRDRRKLFGGTAIYSEEGVLLASSAATWVELSTRMQSPG